MKENSQGKAIKKERQLRESERERVREREWKATICI